MKVNVKKWFGNIDKAPHIYTAYADGPTTARAFKDFKQYDSEHL